MKVLFDNCTAPVFATPLDGLIGAFGHRALHIKDIAELPDGRHSTDLAWIRYLQSRPEDWAFITGDRRVLKNSAERAALRSAGLHGFVLAPAFQKISLNQAAATIVWKWPEIEAMTKLVAAPSMHEVPIGKGSKLRSLPL